MTNFVNDGVSRTESVLLVIAAVVCLVSLWRAVRRGARLRWMPQSRPESNAPLRFATAQRNTWAPGVPIVFHTFHPDLWTISYFNLQASWISIENAGFRRVDESLDYSQSQKSPLWLEVTAYDFIAAKPEGRQWLALHERPARGPLSLHALSASDGKHGSNRMKLDLIEFARYKTPEYDCSYIPSEVASLQYRSIGFITSRRYQELLCRGWRRFGHEFFRPACRNCVKCRSLRVLVDDFVTSKSQRRAIKQNAATELVIQAPTVSKQHLRLYDAYHTDMHFRRGWPARRISKEQYVDVYVASPGTFAREFLYFRHGKLIGVGLVDVLPEAMSSIYFYHDPAERSHALGVYSLLRELRYAKEHGIRHHYLGYWIPECQSMGYKANYRPHEILQRYPEDAEEPVWLRPEAPEPTIEP